MMTSPCAETGVDMDYDVARLAQLDWRAPHQQHRRSETHRRGDGSRSGRRGSASDLDNIAQALDRYGVSNATPTFRIRTSPSPVGVAGFDQVSTACRWLSESGAKRS